MIANFTEYFTAFLLLAGGLVLTALAATIIYGLFSQEHRGKSISFLLEGGKSGKPSISRLQMLVWNFVVAFSFLYVLGNLTLTGADPGDALKGALEALLNAQVLTLLGISNGTYVVGKLTSQGNGSGSPGEGDAESMTVASGVNSIPLSSLTDASKGPVG
jgi:hypothetical protein